MAAAILCLIAIIAATAGGLLLASGLPLVGVLFVGVALVAARASGRCAAWDAAQRWND